MVVGESGAGTSTTNTYLSTCFKLSFRATGRQYLWLSLPLPLSFSRTFVWIKKNACLRIISVSVERANLLHSEYVASHPRPVPCLYHQ
jgi:hypothetical protein